MPAIEVKTYQQGFFGDWQYLIILDACRYDVFAQIAHVEGWAEPLKLDTRCHCTDWWYRKYWSREDTDVNLVSANPVPFHKDMGWDAWRRFKTATWADPASEVVKALGMRTYHSVFDPMFTLQVFKAVKQPGERYVIHLMPPHLPFLGKVGRMLFKDLGLSINGDRFIYKAIQDYGREGHWEELYACYRENIEYSLDALTEYQYLFTDGKTVITSDHAELIGEPAFDEEGIYRHAKYIEIHDLWMILRTVPWMEWKGQWMKS